MEIRKGKGKIPTTVIHNGQKIADRVEIEYVNGQNMQRALAEPLQMKFKDHELGDQIEEILEMKSDRYHFFFIDKNTGEKLMPYKIINGVRVFFDFRNILLSEKTDGLELVICCVAECCDIHNSHKQRYDAAHMDFDTISLSELAEEINRGMRRMIIGQVSHRPDDRPYRALLQLLMQSKMDGASIREKYLRKLLEGSLFSYSDGLAGHLPSEVKKTLQIEVRIPLGAAPVSPDGYAAQLSGLPMQLPYAPGGQFSEMLLESSGETSQANGLPASRPGSPHRAAYLPDRQAVHLPAAHRPHQSFTNPVPIASLSSFRAAIFDLDGVMVDSEKAHLETFNSVLADFGVKISPSHWARNYTGVGSRAIMKDIVSKHGIPALPEALVERRAEVYQQHIDSKGLPAMPGLLQAVRLLEKEQVKVMVASSGQKSHVKSSLKSLGLEHIPFLGLEDVAHPKPDPELFLLAAQKLGVSPSGCIVFEDSLAGVEAAARAQMACIALSTTVTRKELEGRAALVVNSFKSPALLKLLSRLAAGKTPASARRG